MTFDSENNSSSEEPLQKMESMPKKRIYIVVGLFLITVIVIGAVFTIFASGTLGSWGQRISITHSPIITVYAGEKIEIKAKISGEPKNVTLHYLVNPNNLTSTPYSSLRWHNVYMLLVGAGGEEYSYTIPANEVVGDIHYYLMATGDYGMAQAEPIMEITVSDFYVEVSDKDLVVYASKPASTKVSIKSIHDFDREVSLKISDLPGGLIAEFNPSKVTPAGGIAESTLTIRTASDQYVPGGEHTISVKGTAIADYLGTTVSITRGTEEFTVKVPDFEFTISPTSHEVKKSEITGNIREKIVSYDIDLTMQYGFQGNLSFNVAGLPTEGVDYRINLADEEFLFTGTTNIELQVIVKSRAPRGTYTMTVTIDGEGYERDKFVTLTITGTTYYQDDYYRN